MVLKIVAAVRRKPGMTHSEFIDYIVDVHGELAKAQPLGLQRYVQNHVYDGAFGTTACDDYAMPFHRDSVTELYFATAADMAANFAHDYTRTVIGPDAANFADLSANEATLTVEVAVFPPVDPTSGTKVMHFLAAHDREQVRHAQAGWQDAHEEALAAAPGFARSLQGSTRSDPVTTAPDPALTAYFGGAERRPLAVVASHWIGDAQVGEFQAYDAAIFSSGLYDPRHSYYLLTREVEIFCT